jgi:NAD(P)-dependent dehydrogenase (short-subunit alcohol dehydrogenase family)
MSTVTNWLDLGGKVVFVTGAARGIGRGIAEAFLATGARVIVADVDAAAVQTTAKALGVPSVTLDVADEVAVDRAIAGVVATHGRLDVIVNNAGVYNGLGGPIVDMKTEVWRKLMSINLDGVFYCCRAAARAMIKQGSGGRIINLSSVQAISPGVGVSYDSSKAAIMQMTRTLALELAPHHINVNAIAPGPTWVMEGVTAPEIPGELPELPSGDNGPLAESVTNRLRRVPLRRWATPLEMGQAAVFLASPMSAYITGVFLPVDGGWLVL